MTGGGGNTSVTARCDVITGRIYTETALQTRLGSTDRRGGTVAEAGPVSRTDAAVGGGRTILLPVALIGRAVDGGGRRGGGGGDGGPGVVHSTAGGISGGPDGCVARV